MRHRLTDEVPCRPGPLTRRPVLAGRPVRAPGLQGACGGSPSLRSSEFQPEEAVVFLNQVAVGHAGHVVADGPMQSIGRDALAGRQS